MDTYEKKYKEAQKWIESIYPNLSHEQQMEAEAFFPELAESEDERIRKELITHCRNTRCVTEEGAERIAKWIDWLEKQGEEKVQAKSLWHEYNDKIDLNRPFLLITPKGQLSIMSWNGKCLRSVTFGGGGGIILEGDRFAYIDELQEIRNPAEWSEEDEEHYELEEFAKIVRGNLSGIAKNVQDLFEAKYQQLTGNKMYGGYKD